MSTTPEDVPMVKTGFLKVEPNGVSSIDGITLAKNDVADPFGGATSFLQNQGLVHGSYVLVIGGHGTIGTTPVLFVTEAHAWQMPLAGNLGGDPVTDEGKVKCKSCGYLNPKVIFLDPDHLPNCKNPSDPVHTLGI